MHVNVRIEPRWTFHRGAARGAGALARDRAARADAGQLRSGGRKSGTASFSITTRTRRTARPARRTRCARCPMRACRRRCSGTRCPTAIRPTSRCSRCRRASRRSAIRTRRWTTAAGSLEKLLELAARDEAAGLGDAPWPPHFRKMEGEAPRVAPSRAKSLRRRRARARTKMPLVVVANSPNKEAALAGLERWKAQASGGGDAARGRRCAGRLDARADRRRGRAFA